MFIDQGESYPIAIHKKLLRAISPKIGNFARAIKSSRDHVCASADAIASNHSRKTKRPDMATILPNLQRLINQCMKVGGIKTWKELTIGDQQLVRLLFTIILSFNIAGKRIALFGATKYFDILMPKISDHLPD